MSERLRISPEVTAVIRQGRVDEKAFYAQDRIEVPFGIQGEELRAEGYKRCVTHSNGARNAEAIERQYNGGASIIDRVDRLES